MQQLKLIIIFLLIPFNCFAYLPGNEITIFSLLSNGLSIFEHAWNYQIILTDNQHITVSNIIIAVIALIIGLKFARYLSKAFKKKLFTLINLDRSSANLIGRAVDYLFMLIIAIIVLDVAGVPISAFTFIGGAIVVSIGLSTQHLVNNFISGIALIIENKIKVGDMIEFDGIAGRVENIEARMVQIKTQTNMEIFIPHSKLMQECFAHWSNHGGKIRISTEIRIDQKDNAKVDFEDIILTAVTQNRYILITPKPQILLLAFDNNILNYEINFWINIDTSDRKIIISEVNNLILSALRAHHISLATPSIKYLK